jgi:hypothetical protein
MKVLESDLTQVAGAYALVAAPFYADIVDRLVEGACQALAEHGIESDQITLVRVPGAFEIPQACRWLDRSGNFAAIIPLGCVIRGETPHFASRPWPGPAAANRTRVTKQPRPPSKWWPSSDNSKVDSTDGGQTSQRIP